MKKRTSHGALLVGLLVMATAPCSAQEAVLRVGVDARVRRNVGRHHEAPNRENQLSSYSWLDSLFLVIVSHSVS